MRTSLRRLSSLIGILAATVAVASAQSGSGPAAAQKTKEPPAEAAKKLQERAAQALRDRIAEEKPEMRKSAVVCGMLVIRADPTIDPAIRKVAPRGKVYTLKTIPPPCERER